MWTNYGKALYSLVDVYTYINKETGPYDTAISGEAEGLTVIAPHTKPSSCYWRNMSGIYEWNLRTIKSHSI